MFSRFEKKEAFTVVGTKVTVPFAEAHKVIAPAVIEFEKHQNQIKNTVGNKTYGVTLNLDKDSFLYLYGVEVSKVEEVPQDLVAREVPASEYAVIVHKGTARKLEDTYKFIWQTWLPQSGYECAKSPLFEVYDERFILDGPHVDDSYMEIYVPIEKKGEQA